MTLVLCPECRHQISTRAATCPQCGYPLTGEQHAPRLPVPVAAPQPVVRTPGTYLTPMFALGASVVLAFTGLFAMVGTEEEGFAVMAGLIAWGSAIPIWWKTRKKARAQALTGAVETQARVDEHLKAIEERFREPLARLDDGTRQMEEIEERMDFLERLMTKVRDDRPGGQ